jgi:hypothetical protein
MPEEITSPENPTEEITDLLALTNKIFNANLAQQNALRHQQAVAQIELVALAKCVQVLLDADVNEPQAIEGLSARIVEMFDQLHTKTEERLSASQKQMNELLDEIRTHAVNA